MRCRREIWQNHENKIIFSHVANLFIFFVDKKKKWKVREMPTRLSYSEFKLNAYKAINFQSFQHTKKEVRKFYFGAYRDMPSTSSTSLIVVFVVSKWEKEVKINSVFNNSYHRCLARTHPQHSSKHQNHLTACLFFHRRCRDVNCRNFMSNAS